MNPSVERRPSRISLISTRALRSMTSGSDIGAGGLPLRGRGRRGRDVPSRCQFHAPVSRFSVRWTYGFCAMICVASSRPPSIDRGSYLITNVCAPNSSASAAAPSSTWTRTSSRRRPSKTESVAPPTVTRPPMRVPRYDSAIARTRLESVRYP